MAKKTNTLKTDKPKKTKDTKVRRKLKFTFLRNEKFKLTFGAFLILFSFYLLFSFVSYFFYWAVDFDKIYAFELSDLSGKVPVQNWGGFIGAWLSHLFIYKLFGISSILIAYLSFISGLRLSLNLNILPLGKSFKVSFLITLWLSPFFGTLFNGTSWAILGGIFGYQLSQWLQNIIGFAGLIILLTFSLFAFLTIQFNFITHFLRHRAQRKEDRSN